MTPGQAPVKMDDDVIFVTEFLNDEGKIDVNFHTEPIDDEL